jgi:hypothetical protein
VRLSWEPWLWRGTCGCCGIHEPLPGGLAVMFELYIYCEFVKTDNEIHVDQDPTPCWLCSFKSRNKRQRGHLGGSLDFV